MQPLKLALIATLFGSLATVTALADPKADWPILPSHGQTPSAFIPAGWQIEAQAQGQLDEGKREAKAFVLKKADAPGASGTQRLIAVIFSTNGGYDLAAQNHTLLPSYSTKELQLLGFALGDGAHVPGLELKRGSLRVHINLSPGSGPTAERDLTYSFRYNNGHLYLVGYDEFIVGSRLGTVSNSYNYLSGKAQLSSGANCAGRADVVAHCRYTSALKTLSTKQPIEIEQIGDGLEFKPATD